MQRINRAVFLFLAAKFSFRTYSFTYSKFSLWFSKQNHLETDDQCRILNMPSESVFSMILRWLNIHPVLSPRGWSDFNEKLHASMAAAMGSLFSLCPVVTNLLTWCYFLGTIGTNISSWDEHRDQDQFAFYFVLCLGQNLMCSWGSLELAM